MFKGYIYAGYDFCSIENEISNFLKNKFIQFIL